MGRPSTDKDHVDAIKIWARRYHKGALPHTVVGAYLQMIDKWSPGREKRLKSMIAKEAGIKSGQARKNRKNRERKEKEAARQLTLDL